MSRRAVPIPIEEFRRKAAAGEEISDALIYKHFIPDQVKVAADTRRVTFTISTGAVDREGDTIAVEGWQLEDYLKNPVVLFAHRYDELPIARAVSIVKGAGALKATAEFPEQGLNPLADTVYEMLKAGFLRATSVGFRPIKSAHNEERPGWATDFLEQELLEFSVVPVPSNPEALMETAKGLTGAIAAGIDLRPLEHALALAKSVSGNTTAIKGVVACSAGGPKAAEDEAWSKPSLSDFTDKNWDDLSDGEKRSIAHHYAWAAKLPPDTFGDLKLPHHNPKSGAVVWKGVAAAMGALLGARGDVAIPDADRRKVYDRLATHYRAFDKEPPDFGKAAPVTTKDGSIPADTLVKIRSAHTSIEAAEVVLEQILGGVDDGTSDDSAALEDFVTKAGRRISAATASTLKDAVDSLDAVAAHHKAAMAHQKQAADTMDDVIGGDDLTVDDSKSMCRDAAGSLTAAALHHKSAALHHKDATEAIESLLKDDDGSDDTGDDVVAEDEDGPNPDNGSGGDAADSVRPVPGTDGDQPWNRGARIVSSKDLRASLEHALSAAVSAGVRAALN